MTDQEHTNAVYEAISIAKEKILKAKEAGLEVKATASYEVVKREFCPRDYIPF